MRMVLRREGLVVLDDDLACEKVFGVDVASLAANFDRDCLPCLVCY